jgi:putative transposase
MPRRSRLCIGGFPTHIVHRGNNRQCCFLGEGDHVFYLELVKEFAARFECAIHAYVLMTNHVHLLLTPAGRSSASLLMKNVAQRFAQRMNRVRERTGVFWEGRFHSGLVETGEHFLACHRYIELNPVRAGMVRSPGEYRWSSHRVNAEGRPSLLVQPHSTYLGLGTTAVERQMAYRALFDEMPSEDELAFIRSRTNAGLAIGSDSFRSDLARKTGRRMDPLLPGPKRSGSVPELRSGSVPELGSGYVPDLW